jgi:hypothetical protein
LQLARMPRCRGAVVHTLDPACHEIFLPDHRNNINVACRFCTKPKGIACD